MENNNDKKLYTLLVYSENIAGILNQITAVFTRRQVNIESLNVSASSIKNIHKYTITVWSDAEQIEKINKAKMTYTIVSESEANLKEGKISIKTPIAQGLLNKKVGEIAEIKIPRGTIKLRIDKISFE